MTTDTIRAKAERALRLHNDAALHIKAREQCQLLGELAREWLREHPEDDGGPVNGPWLVAMGFKLRATQRNQSTYFRRFVFGVFSYCEESKAACWNGCPMRTCNTRGELRRLLAALGVE